MQLVNMKMSAEESSEQYGSSMVSDAPQYPYGLCLTLDDDAIAKLGMPALPQVGQTMIITARVEVTTVSQYENQRDGKEKSMSLQITDMAVSPDKEELSPESIYGAEG